MPATAHPTTQSATSTLTIGGVAWSCSDSSAGAERAAAPLLVLPGALGLVDSGGPALAHLAKTRRVIGLAYPEVERMTELCDAIAALLDALSVGRVDVLGASLGGWVAQCLVRRHPRRVRHMVLSHTFALRPGDARRIRIGTRLWRLLPAPLFRALLEARVRQALAPLRRAGNPDYDVWMEGVRRGMGTRFTPAALIRVNAWMLESLEAFRFAPGDLANHAGRVLVIESDDDPVLRASSRAALRALYPSARVRAFRGTGHATALVAPAEYAVTIAAFLDEDA